jgi:3D (Asp-Asp-Asp) domain-containing protein
MIKKITISAVLLMIFVLSSTTANAAGWSLDSTSDNAHPLINSDSNWSMNNVYGDMLGLDTAQDTQPEKTPEPAPVLVQKTKTVKTEVKMKSITSYVVMASAYSSTPDQTDSTPFITAWGTQVRDGIIAANFLPFGTLIKIPDIYGDKVFTVEDRMNKRYTYKIDIWFPERELAKIFGIKKVKIEVVAKL